MPSHPLLLFPSPEHASRSNLSGRGGRFHKPSAQRQMQRLSPVFAQLQNTFEARRVEIQNSANGVDPEEVLVIETIGSIENFVIAVRRIDGLEWLGEFERDEIESDDDFYDEDNRDKKLGGRLYLVISNQQAFQEMLSLWRRYEANPNMHFEVGLTKFRDVFLQLKTIRRWDVQDRFEETGVIEAWQEDLAYDGDRLISFEIELWFRKNDASRSRSALKVTELIEDLGGQIVNAAIIDGITYHGLLAELPANAIGNIIENPNTELVKCENIMFFRPVGQAMDVLIPQEGDENNGNTNREVISPRGAPIIALLDGLPLSNHRLLASHILLDDPDDFASEYLASERIHGTSMSSFIIHGDLNSNEPPLTRPIYTRPIMKPIFSHDSPRPEGFPENYLVVDLVHRSVKRIFEGEGTEGPVAPNIRIINLSIGDPARQFVYSMSPMARLLDWLSVKYGVLFVVSAGNHATPIALDISRTDFCNKEQNEIEAETIKALYRDARNRRILSPAESINALTVGAAHFDTSIVSYVGVRIDPFEQLLPSPISAFGSGYRRSIKPDIIYHGGKQWYQLPAIQTDPTTIEIVKSRLAPGNLSAAPCTLGGLDKTSYSRGTSNATALISRSAGICYDSISEIFAEHGISTVSRYHEVSLLKAILVHGSSWGDIGMRIADVLRTPDNSRQIDSLVSKWMGYGFPDIQRVLNCTEQRATLLGYGELTDGRADIFTLPLPQSLSSQPIKRRLTVTLAWLSPILPQTQKYRTSSLWFEIVNPGLTPNRQDADWRAVKRGTVQHEVFEGERAEPFINGDAIKIKVNCREDAGKIETPIAYGLVVSLEVAEGQDIAIYNEIRTHITPTVQIGMIP